jgi:hypothetical protein
MANSWAVAIGVCVVAGALAGCDAGPALPVKEVVLHPGESIQAVNKFGSVRIAYVSPLKREFVWDGQSRTVKLMSRPERWLGELGLYDPADCVVILLPLCRTPRLAVEEAFHDFDDYQQLYAFIRQGSAIMDWVYTSDGLLVGFGRFPKRQQINIEVRQLTIHGQKPANLRGARNKNIRLTSTHG